MPLGYDGSVRLAGEYQRPRRLFGHQPWPLPLAALCAVAVLVGGCEAGNNRGLEVWAGEDVPGVAAGAVADDLAPLYDPTNNQVTLAGAINETLTFCLALTATDEPLEGLSVSATALKSGDARIPANAVTLYRVQEVEVGPPPGWHIRSVEPQHRIERVGDVLVPVDAGSGGLPDDLPVGESLAVWLDVDIPKGTAPGTYFGQVLAQAGDRTVRAVGLRVTVWPFVLPDTADVVLLADLDHPRLFRHHVFVDGRPYAPLRRWGDDAVGAQLDGVLTDTVRLLQSHRVTALLPRLTPDAKVDGDARLTLDWSHYDRIAVPLLDGRHFFDRRPLPLWQIPFSEEFPAPPVYGAVFSPTYSRLTEQYLAACARHFADLGWLDRSFVVLPSVEAPVDDAYRTIRHFGRIARKADRNLQRLATFFPQDMALYGWDGFVWQDVARYVDIWAPPAQFFEPQQMRQQRMLGRRTFWSLNHPPFSGSLDLSSGSSDVRVIGWQARGYGIEAVLLGTINGWPDEPDTAEPQDCCHDGAAPLIYPGRHFGLTMPVPSARLKRLRRSMQDVAYLSLLNDLGLEHIGAALTQALCQRAGTDAYGAHFADGAARGWTSDPGLWSLARRIMADEIVRAMRRNVTAGDSRPDDGSSAVVANTVQWRRFMDATRRLDIQVDGVRARPVGRMASGTVEVAVSVTLTNHTRGPLGGRLAFEELPLAWQAESADIEVPAIAPGASRRITLRATTPVMETGSGAVRYLPLVLRTSDLRMYRFQARLGYLIADGVKQVPVIDGDLSDWPGAVVSAADDFVLITGEDPEDTDSAQARPTSGTQCFVAADSDAIYFAFNCAIDPTADLPVGLRSHIRREDGVPVDDELIEILLDPTNAGTRSTADLYHVVLKPNGWFCERGIETDPPTGAREPWAADLAAAVAVHPDRWVAEVRIPRDAFDAGPGQRRIWGFNVTRFDLVRQEFSNWSGAVGNAYDPLSLGNLALP